MLGNVILQNLSIGYTNKGEKRVVAKQLNGAINSGELTCLLGRNGIGKSTLLRTLAAFQPALEGDVLLQGKALAAYSDQQLSQQIGVVLTEKPQVRNMTVDELVSLGRSPYTGFWGTYSDDDRRIVSKAIEQVGIADLQDRLVDTLSDGERQKVMIAKALAQETPVIYLDEPTAFLDYPSKVEMMQLLFKLSRETDKTIFLSTHDLELALQIADKLWLMDKQQGVRIGAPEDLSLDGSLGSYFARKGIVFDLETGLFRVENDYTRKIRLKGEGVRFMMVSKALKRIGIQGNDKVEDEDFVEICSDRYILHQSDKTTECMTIADLLNELK